jgi:hypothetical protein
MKKILDTATVSSFERYSRYLLFLLLLIAGALRIQHLSWGLPDLYEDAIPFHVSYDFWNWDAKGITLNPSYFSYPALTSYLNFFVQGIVFAVGYALRFYADFPAFQQMSQENVTTFVTIGRSVSVAFDLGTILIVYLLCRRIVNWKAGLLAAFIIAFNPLHIKESNLINFDTPLTFFFVLSLYFIYRLYTENENRWYILAGAAIGLAAASRYSGGLLVFSLFAVEMMKTGKSKGVLQSLKNSFLWLSILTSLGVFVILNPYLVLRFKDVIAELNGTSNVVKYTPLLFDAKSWSSLFSNLPENLGWGLILVVVASIVYAVVKKRKELLIFFIIPAICVLILGAMFGKHESCLLSIFPLLIASGAIFLVSIYDQLRGSTNVPAHFSSPLRAGLSVLALIIVFYFPVQSIAARSRKFTTTDTRFLARQMILDHLPQEGVVASGPYGINLPPGSRVLTFPFNASHIGKSAPFYDSGWYRDFDLVVVSSYEQDLCRGNTGVCENYSAFYKSLRTQSLLIDSVISTDYNNGPSFWIYRPSFDSSDTPFDPSLIAKLDIADKREAANFMDDLGMFLTARGKFLKAEQALQYAVEHDSGLVIARQHLGMLQMNIGKYEEAAKNFRAYIQRNPSDALMQAAIGDAFYQLGRLDEAERNYLAAVDIDGACDDAYRGLVRIYTDKNDNISMIHILERYLGHLPATSENAMMIRLKIEELKKGEIRK